MPNMRINNLGIKLALQVTFVIVLVMGIVGVLSTYQQERKFTSILQTRADWMVQQLAVALEFPMWNFDEAQIDNLLATYLANTDVLAVELVEAESENPLRSIGKDPAAGKVLDLTGLGSHPAYDNAFSVKEEIVHGQELLGSVEVTFSREFITSQMSETVAIGAIALVSQVAMVTLILLILVRRKITLPLAANVEAAKQIAAGDLDVRLADVKSSDEIGSLNAAFGDMVDYLREMAMRAGKISEGDLRHEFAPRSNNDVLGEAFLRMTRYLRNMASSAADIAGGDLRQEIQPSSEHDSLGSAFQQMASLRQIVGQVMDGSVQLEAASNTLEKMSNDMAGDAQRASEQIHEISASGQRVTLDVTNIATAMAAASKTVDGLAANTRKIADIATEATQIVNGASDVIGTLAQRSHEIEELVDLISGIAKKSHLLALNATIEAHRTGESNRFEVVAAEVKDLAESTAHSAEDISQRAEAIQQSSDESSKAIQQLSDIVGEIRELTATNATAVEQQNATQHSISDSTGSLVGNSEGITQTMGDVAVGSVQITERAQSVRESAQQLSQLADKLQRAVEQFKV